MGIIFIVISLISSYLIMLEFSEQISSSCFECSYLEEILIMNIQSLLIIPLMYFIVKFLNKQATILMSVLLVLNIFFIAKSLFAARVSSWSSYSATDEFIAVMYQSYCGIIASVIIFLIIKYIISRKDISS